MAIYRLEFDDYGHPLFIEDEGSPAATEEQNELQDSVPISFDGEDPLDRIRRAGW